MAGKYGVKETKEALDLGFAGYDFGKVALADGKLSLADMYAAWKLFPFVAPAVNGIDLVPKEFSELDAQDAAELVAHVVAKLNVDDVKAKAILEKGLLAAKAAYEFYLAVKG